MKSFKNIKLKVSGYGLRSKVILLGGLAIIIAAVLIAAIFLLSGKKDDVAARKSVEKAVLLLSKDSKKNADAAVKLLDKSISLAKTPQQMYEKKASVCQQFELHDCAINAYQDLISNSDSSVSFYKKKQGDSYRYAKKNTEAIRAYEGVKRECNDQSKCQGISVVELDYFIKQLKENKPIVETQ